MNWLAITLLGYFLLALEIIFDKFLLSSKRVSHPAIYTFYSGTVGMFVVIFMPFGFHLISLTNAALYLLSGIIFIYGMFSLFSAINRNEASRVIPVVGATTPVVVFFLSKAFLGEHLTSREIVGLIILIVGGLWISFDISENNRRKLFTGFKRSILAGVLLAISATLLKAFYNHDNFLNVFIWRGLGEFIGVLVFFLVPSWRKKILGSLMKFKKPEREHKTSGVMYIATRITGGLGSIIKEKAVSLPLASVTLVNALVSTEYVFVFLLGLGFSFWLPKIFREETDWETIIQKILSILLIALGIFLVVG